MSTDRVSYRAFRSSGAYTDDMYNVFRSIYELPEIETESEVDDRELYEYCLRRKYFTIIAPYCSDGRLVLERSYADGKLAWSIIGGGVRPEMQDSFVSSCNRHLLRRIPGIELGEIEPVAFLKNKFKYNQEHHEHLGIAFVGRIRNEADVPRFEAAEGSRWQLVPTDYIPTRMTLEQHVKLIPLIHSRIKNRTPLIPQEEEIEANQKYRARYVFHNNFMKPTLKFVSQFVAEHTINDLYKKIDEEVFFENSTKILDVACGENLATIEGGINRNIDLLVGNDISWSQIELANERIGKNAFRNSRSFVLFTNHDARNMPFADKAFDTVICKNVLHHMPDQDSARSILSEMLRVGKRVVVIDVLDPIYEGVWGRLRHRWYMDFLKDAGNSFLSREEFFSVTDIGRSARRYEMNTVRAVYQFAILE